MYTRISHLRRPNATRLLLATLTLALAGGMAQTVAAAPADSPPGAMMGGPHPGMHGGMRGGPGMAMGEPRQMGRMLNLVFKIADDNGLLVLDLKDLRAMLKYVGDNAGEFTTRYGNVSAARVGAIQRGLLQIESQGGEKFFGGRKR